MGTQEFTIYATLLDKYAGAAPIGVGTRTKDGILVTFADGAAPLSFPSLASMRSFSAWATSWTEYEGMMQDPFFIGREDALLDCYENAHYASIGGRDRKDDPVAPDRIAESDRKDYLDGYLDMARELYETPARSGSRGQRPASGVLHPSPRKSGRDMFAPLYRAAFLVAVKHGMTGIVEEEFSKMAHGMAKQRKASEARVGFLYESVEK